MRRFRWILVSMVAGSLAAALPEDGSALSALSIMDVPMGARSVAMGEAFSAVVDDSSAIYWNPAGLSQQKLFQIGLTHSKWFLDSSFQNFDIVIPTKVMTTGISLMYVDAGFFERRDEYGALLEGKVNPYQLGGTIAAGREFGSMSLGLSLKGYKEVIDDFKITGYALDMGSSLDLGKSRFSMVIHNLGRAATYRTPLNYRLGAAYNYEKNNFGLILSTDLEMRGKRKTMFFLGLEAGYKGLFFIRTGFRGNRNDDYFRGLQSLAGGVGLKFPYVVVDYAVVPYGQLGTLHRVSLTFSGMQKGGSI